MPLNEDLLKSLEDLNLKKNEWVYLEPKNKVKYLFSTMDKLIQYSDEWVKLSTKAKGIDFNTSLAGQEYITGPCIIMKTLKNLSYSLLNLDENKNVTLKNDRLTAKLLPLNKYDKLIWRKFSAEIKIERNKPASRGQFYKEKNKNGALCLILGAGNQSSIAPLDALTKLFHEGHICLVKLNPVNDYLLETLNYVFADFIQDGYLKFIKADNETSNLLCHHENIDEIHITGSHHTHDLIVWGEPNDEETKIRKEQNKPKLTKKITSELGCVSPVIMIPGVWREQDLQFQAKHIVSMVENNASFNCNAAKVLILQKQWPQRELFLNYLREEFKKCPTRHCYYPGAKNRYKSFLNQYPDAEKFGEDGENTLPWLFIPNVKPNENEFALQNEAFCGVFAEVSLEAQSVDEFFNFVQKFTQEKIWGTLSCTVIIDPKTKRIFKNEFENLLEKLEYGSIGVNCWAAVSYALGVTAWGAYPGHTLQNIQSGIGMVHNDFLYDYPEKSIVRAPFRMWPKPIYFYDNKNAKEIAKNLIQFEYSRNLISFSKLIFSALKG